MIALDRRVHDSGTRQRLESAVCPIHPFGVPSMSKRLLLALAGLASVAAHAVDVPPVGDPEAGADKAASCAACHGMDGNSPAPEWPKLAGQHEDYGLRHTILVRDGGREVPVMHPFVAGLSDQDLADIAAFYSRQTIRAGVADDSAIPDREDTFAALGQRLYRSGKAAAGVPACAACHGPTGRGVPAAGYPALAGQHATYTAARLQFFHDGGHYGDDGDPSQIMVTIAQRLDLTEMNALATFIEGLHRFDANAAAVAALPAAPADPGPTTGPGAVEDVTPAPEPAPADGADPGAEPPPGADAVPAAEPPPGDDVESTGDPGT
jgi:cytochrome c553